MYCEEPIKKVYTGVVEDDFVYSHNAFLDCYHEIAYHCTQGYRLVLETENYAISLSCNGVTVEKKEDLREKRGEWLQSGVELFEEDEPYYVSPETTLLVGERLISVTDNGEYYSLRFDDFDMRLVPHRDSSEVEDFSCSLHGSYHHILGCDRHLKEKCPHCKGDGEILLDFVKDYVVRCRRCKRSTYAEMCLTDAIDCWNEGNAFCDLSDITIIESRNS